MTIPQNIELPTARHAIKHVRRVEHFLRGRIIPTFLADDAVGTVRFVGKAMHGKAEGKKRVGVELSTVRHLTTLVGLASTIN